LWVLPMWASSIVWTRWKGACCCCSWCCIGQLGICVFPSGSRARVLLLLVLLRYLLLLRCMVVVVVVDFEVVRVVGVVCVWCLEKYVFT
jgi:hypothetical protein